METHYKNFMTTFYKFTSDVNRYYPTPGTKKALEEFDNFDIAKLIFRTYHLLKDNLKQITDKDNTLFKNTFVVLPDVDIASIWSHLIKGQKDKVWTYLSILQIESELIMDYTKNIAVVEQEPPINAVIEQEKPIDDFNPYIGIGVTNATGYSVNEMFSALPETDEQQSSGPGIEAIAKMIGLNKLVNFDELADQLKNMKKEDIESATNGIKELLGNNLDEKTTSLFTNMLTDISDEMKNTDMTKGDSFANLMGIAESVAGKMKPTIDRDNIDISQLISSTQVFANQCKDANGKPLFEGKMNPFSLLSQFSNPNGGINEEECMAQCTSMLNSMGVSGNMLQMMAGRGGPPPKKNNSKRGRKKRN